MSTKIDRRYHKLLSIERESMAEVLEQADKNLTNMPADYQRMVSEVRDKNESEPSQLVDTTAFKPIQDEQCPRCPTHGGRLLPVLLGEEWHGGKEWFCPSCLFSYSNEDLKAVC